MTTMNSDDGILLGRLDGAVLRYFTNINSLAPSHWKKLQPAVKVQWNAAFYSSRCHTSDSSAGNLFPVLSVLCLNKRSHGFHWQVAFPAHFPVLSCFFTLFDAPVFSTCASRTTRCSSLRPSSSLHQCFGRRPAPVLLTSEFPGRHVHLCPALECSVRAINRLQCAPRISQLITPLYDASLNRLDAEQNVLDLTSAPSAGGSVNSTVLQEGVDCVRAAVVRL